MERTLGEAILKTITLGRYKTASEKYVAGIIKDRSLTIDDGRNVPPKVEIKPGETLRVGKTARSDRADSL